MERYHNVTLCIDIMYVNKIAFLVMIFHGIKSGTAETLKDRKHPTIMTAIKDVVAVYSQSGFRVNDETHTDNEFEPMRAQLMDSKVRLDVVSNNEHVPKIERHIRTVKENMRYMDNTVPFKKMPSRIIMEMVVSAAFWLKMFPPIDGVSKVINPRGIIHGLTLLTTTNTIDSSLAATHKSMKNMTTPCKRALPVRSVCDLPALSKGYYFMSLTNGRRLTRNHWAPLQCHKM